MPLLNRIILRGLSVIQPSSSDINGVDEIIEASVHTMGQSSTGPTAFRRSVA